MLALKLADTLAGVLKGVLWVKTSLTTLSPTYYNLTIPKLKLNSKESNFLTGGNYNMRVTALGRVKTTALEEHWI